jgi:hypothetical protein
MNLPGFTAEAALRRADARQARAGVLNATADKGRVVPQFGCSREGTMVSLRDGSVSGFYCCTGPFGWGRYCFSIRER